MAIGIGQNIAALGVQRQLASTTDALSRIYERLASGQRINRASDDAAGLSIAASLSAHSRVYGQAIRNVNDGMSSLQIASSALTELMNIATRQLELAAQAANGSYSTQQRQALNDEANTLVDEYNRIVSTTSFNGLNLLDGTLGSAISIQAGIGADATLSVSLGSQLARTLNVGTGVFTTSGTFTAGDSPCWVITEDFNHDAKMDLVASDQIGNFLSVYFGNGNGTFQARVTLAGGLRPSIVATADFDRDGQMDLAASDYNSSTVSVYLGNADGTFKARTSYAMDPTNPFGLAAADMTGDGVPDIVSSGGTTGTTMSVFVGNGNGTFAARVSYFGILPYTITLANLNSDGKQDVVSPNFNNGAGTTLSLLFGNGNGTLQAPISFVTALGPITATVTDINSDSRVDILVACRDANVFSIYLGNGNGTFAARSTIQFGRPQQAVVFDSNGDGIVDIMSPISDASALGIALGNGNGTFQATTTAGVGSGPMSATAGDFNQDGVLDVAVANLIGDTLSVLLDGARQVTTPFIDRLDLSSQSSARSSMDTLRATLDRISAEQGSIGALQSRLEYALRNLATTRENYNAAHARITDADMAEETSQLLRRQILQQASAAVLAQANQQPALALRLLTQG